MPVSNAEGAHVPEYVHAWQCIGCGKIEAPQTCVGVCQDRKVALVYVAQYRDDVAQLQSRLDAAMLLVRQMATVTPRNGEWERSYRALQREARQVLTVDRECLRAQAAGSDSAGAMPNNK